MRRGCSWGNLFLINVKILGLWAIFTFPLIQNSFLLTFRDVVAHSVWFHGWPTVNLSLALTPSDLSCSVYYLDYSALSQNWFFTLITVSHIPTFASSRTFHHHSHCRLLKLISFFDSFFSRFLVFLQCHLFPACNDPALASSKLCLLRNLLAFVRFPSKVSILYGLYLD